MRRREHSRLKTGLKLARIVVMNPRPFEHVPGLSIFLIVLAGQAISQPTQVPPTQPVRPHLRIEQHEVPGRRIQLRTIEGSRLFVTEAVDNTKGVPLIVHFHGAAWLIESHIPRELPNAALITINLGAGSSVYGNPFKQAGLFQSLLDEAKEALDLERPWSSITLTGFSAGYGAIRAILRHERHFAKVNNVLLLDGIHASYSSEERQTSAGGTINATDLDSFFRFAREAVAGRKGFIITHSQIFPGRYASTSECADRLIAELGLQRRLDRRIDPPGMQQLSVVRVGRLKILGYAGNTAQDHVDHLHAMHYWLRSIPVR